MESIINRNNKVYIRHILSTHPEKREQCQHYINNYIDNSFQQKQSIDISDIYVIWCNIIDKLNLTKHYITNYFFYRDIESNCMSTFYGYVMKHTDYINNYITTCNTIDNKYIIIFKMVITLTKQYYKSSFIQQINNIYLAQYVLDSLTTCDKNTFTSCIKFIIPYINDFSTIYTNYTIYNLLNGYVSVYSEKSKFKLVSSTKSILLTNRQLLNKLFYKVGRRKVIQSRYMIISYILHPKYINISSTSTLYIPSTIRDHICIKNADTEYITHKWHMNYGYAEVILTINDKQYTIKLTLLQYIALDYILKHNNTTLIDIISTLSISEQMAKDILNPFIYEKIIYKNSKTSKFHINTSYVCNDRYVTIVQPYKIC